MATGRLGAFRPRCGGRLSRRGAHCVGGDGCGDLAPFGVGRPLLRARAPFALGVGGGRRVSPGCSRVLWRPKQASTPPTVPSQVLPPPSPPLPENYRPQSRPSFVRDISGWPGHGRPSSLIDFLETESWARYTPEVASGRPCVCALAGRRPTACCRRPRRGVSLGTFRFRPGGEAWGEVRGVGGTNRRSHRGFGERGCERCVYVCMHACIDVSVYLCKYGSM